MVSDVLEATTMQRELAKTVRDYGSDDLPRDSLEGVEIETTVNPDRRGGECCVSICSTTAAAAM